MKLYEANKAIVDRWAAMWPPLRPNVSYVLDNEIASTPEAVTYGWARLVTDETVRRQHTLGPKGARVFRSTGLALVQLFAPAGGGADYGKRLGEDVRTIFEGETFGGVSTYAVNVRGIGPDGPSGGRWHMTLVEIVFDFDDQK